MDLRFFAPASVQNVEQVRGRHAVPEVHEALGCRNPFEATWLRVRDPATDREGPSAPIIILDPQDREPRRAPWYARNRCNRSLPPHQPSDAIVATPCYRVARVPGLPRSAPVAALEVPPPPAGATNVPLPVTMIFSPSAAVADAEPKISHPMWAAAVGAAALAENSLARDVEGAAIGTLLSHARARPIATTPRSLVSHSLPFIVPPCRSHRELRMHVTEAPWVRRRTSTAAQHLEE